MKALKKKNLIIGLFLIMVTFDCILFQNKCNGQWNRAKDGGITHVEKRRISSIQYIRYLVQFKIIPNPTRVPTSMVRINRQ